MKIPVWPWRKRSTGAGITKNRQNIIVRCTRRTGKKEQARELFTALRQRDPNDKDVASALRSLPPTPAPIVAQKPRSIVPAKKQETVASAAKLIPEPAATPAATEGVTQTKTEA